MKIVIILLSSLLFLPTPLLAQVKHYQCYKDAATRYSISPALLKAIGEVESNHNASAENKTSKARGILQIHPWWWPLLERKHNIRATDLWDACININVGAWILKQEIERYGLTWTAIGAYYAGAYKTNKKNEYETHYLTYTQKIYNALKNY